MTDKGWADGTARLKSCCVDRLQEPAMRDTRWREYRRALDHLTDAQFGYACDRGVEEEFLPSIGKLRAWGEAAPVPPPKSALRLADEDVRERERVAGLTPEQRQAEARVGLDMIQAGLKACGIVVARSMPTAATDERLAELQRQREQLLGQPQETT